MSDFYVYMKKQLKDYILNEYKKGVSMEEIEKALHNAGHDKNVVDECFSEIKTEEAGMKPAKIKGEAASDAVTQIKGSIQKFFAQIQSGEMDKTKTEASKTNRF